MSFFGDLLKGASGLPDVKAVVDKSTGRVLGKVTSKVKGLKTEEAVRGAISDVAAGEVEEIVDDMLGDNRNTVPRRLKEALVGKATDAVVDAVWAQVKDKMAKDEAPAAKA